MSDFLKQFLRDDVRKLAPDTGRALFLGAFGKHPGWDDHIEETSLAPDLGLRTQSLVLAKTVLYVHGIGRNIDTGHWEKLEPAQQLAGFNHVYLWAANDQCIVGRLWSSSDGKGRTRYPMGVQAHAAGVSLSWVLSVVVPRMEQLRQECGAISTALEVAQVLGRAREELRGLLPEDGRSVPPITEMLGRFVRHPQFGPGHEGLLRVLYQLQSQVPAYAPGRFNPRAGASALRPQDVRVPAAGHEPGEIFCAWTNLLRSLVDPAAPILFLWPAAEEWLDILIGEPEPDQFFCLRTTPVKFPCASEIPFNLDANFRAQAQGRLDAFVRGETPKVAESKVARLFGSLFKR
ncbi:MAG: hypothetical protein HZA90_24230 [Verrucomicrobia bacterium]|nr:hypothetical protein [Verrucomicrobiota bacterium]